ncbi:tRNA (mo5U34)-methyltransferase [Allopseudospirillum japonicum]|uniref:tRNA U34 carboxymethyltransferase n=1 Tax=Allopseudospirillum japonicum TaxID=64971 RepID=A0A1H6TSA4_9GAMM|nr:tRNA 5-methoxyuridine(34)/uridine 5-oxyacetic acid(34) synthase CmoB [Allopseudospirillum japonicum]SEI78602.1 tRNA (mo5U34)-methyltransferase [Allopseudospirillum japonicum]
MAFRLASLEQPITTLDQAALYQQMASYGAAPWLALLPQQMAQGLDTQRHADLKGWARVLHKLPTITDAQIQLDQETVRIFHPDIDAGTRAKIAGLLKQLMPWRKGPFEVHQTLIDTEWRSDWKWQRLAPHIQPLQGRKVLDVGCGNGYHCWRMAGAGAQWVVGIDPSPRFYMQFQAIRHFIGDADAYRVHHIPVGLEALPPELACFDTCFSMGVLYHRPSPIDHLWQLKGTLRPGGELILETLVIDGDENQVLVPEGRYAKMPNVWFLPSVAALSLWLRKCGFTQVRCLDVSTTSVQEQRATEWMTYQSLQDFLDPADTSRTCEGLPAPKRAIFSAIRAS